MKKLFILKYMLMLVFCVCIEPSFAISGWEAECFHAAVPQTSFRRPIQPGSDRLSPENIFNRNTLDMSGKDKTTRVFIPATPHLLAQSAVFPSDENNPICWLACDKREDMLINSLSAAESVIIRGYTTLVTKCIPKDDDNIQEEYTTVHISDSEFNEFNEFNESKDFLDLFLSHAHTGLAHELALTLFKSQKHGLIEWVKSEGHTTFRLSQKGQTMFEKGIDTGFIPYPEALQFRDILVELKPEYFSMTTAETRFVQHLRKVAPIVTSVIELNPVILTGLLSLSSAPYPPKVIVKDPTMLFAYHSGIQKDVSENTTSGDYIKARNSVWDTIFALKVMLSIADSE